MDTGDVAGLLGLSHRNAVSVYHHRFPVGHDRIRRAKGKVLLWLRPEISAWHQLAVRHTWPQFDDNSLWQTTANSRAVEMEITDLQRLTDVDFEAVTHDLFQQKLKTPLELFAPGKDGGIDLRHLSPDGHKTVIQCKHWWRSGGASLVRHMRDHESKKLESLQPDRYVLVTSADLSVGQKSKLQSILSNWLVGPTDIVGGREFVQMLEDYPQVVRKHIRLWLSSTAILNSIVHQEIHVRSAMLIEDAEEASRVWVDNQSRDRAGELLENSHIAVIAGIPGIGKTTLAQVLCSIYATEGYEIVDVGGDIDEAYAMWDPSTPQLFYYDDFLGQTAITEKLGKNEDGRLLAFMRRVRRTPNKRLILTTREYILEQSRHTYERIANTDFDPLKCVINLADYSRRVRARILYNHLYFSDIGEPVLSHFAQPTAYKAIIDHKNFNPRLVTRALRYIEDSEVDSEEALALLLRSLDHPASLWEHLVNEQFDETSRQLLAIMTVLPSSVYLDELTACYQNLGDCSDGTVTKSVRTLDGTAILSRLHSDELVVEFHNPGVRDYLINWLAGSNARLSKMLESAEAFELLEGVWRLSGNSVTNDAFTPWIQQHKRLVGETLLRTLDSPPLRFNWDVHYGWKAPAGVALLKRLPVALKIAELIERDEVNTVLAQRLTEIDVDLDEEYWELAKEAANSTEATFNAAGEGLIERLSELALQSLDTVSELADVTQMVNELGYRMPDYVKDEVTTAIEKILEERAGNEFENIDDDLDRLTYQLEYEGSWSVNQDSLNSIISQFDDLRSNEQSRNVVQNKADSPSSAKDEQEIETLFQLLSRH